ncbi:MAG: hypothetical protein ACR2FN_11770 [Chitinophagaceae bacterium]
MLQEKFEVEYQGKKIKIEIFHPSGQTIYKANLFNGQPLILHRAKGFNVPKAEGKILTYKETDELIEKAVNEELP